MSAASYALTRYVQQRTAIDAAAKRKSWSIVSDDRQSGWYDPGIGVRCDQDGVLENEVPLQSDRKAQEFLEELEAREAVRESKA